MRPNTLPGPPGGIPGPPEHFPPTQVCQAGHGEFMLQGAPKTQPKRYLLFLRKS